jgi:hypothetical protein
MVLDLDNADAEDLDSACRLADPVGRLVARGRDMEVHRSFRAADSSLHQRIKVTATHDSGGDLVQLSLALLAFPGVCIPS